MVAVVAPADVACVCASANGNVALDNLEAQALQQVFGQTQVPIIAPAALFGDTAGACAALHVALTLLMCANGCLPPVVGLETPAKPGLFYVTKPDTPLRAGPVLVLTSDLSGSFAVILFTPRANASVPH